MKVKCCVCNKIYIKILDKNENEIHEHDCLLYEHLFQNKRITRVELID